MGGKRKRLEEGGEGVEEVRGGCLRRFEALLAFKILVFGGC